MTDNDEKFLEELDTLYAPDESVGSKSVAMNYVRDEVCTYVYDYFGELILQKEIKRADEIIAALFEKKYDVWVLLPFLTLSRSMYTESRAHISNTNRARLFEYVIKKSQSTYSSTQLETLAKRLRQ